MQLYNINYQEFCLVQLDNADLSAGSKQQDRPTEFKMATNYFYIYVIGRKTCFLSLEFTYRKVFSILQSTNYLVLAVPLPFISNVSTSAYFLQIGLRTGQQ